MKITFLDRSTIGEDVDVSYFSELGEVEIYDNTTEEEMPERVQEAEVLVVNKLKINEKTLKGADRLRLVCVTATGTDNLDLDYLEQRGIAWRNVSGYSTESVAQHTFSLLFYLWEKLPYYDAYVKEGNYAGDRNFTHFSNTFLELSGKTFGIIGLGNIGRRVGELAQAFGCRVLYYSASGKNNCQEYERVDLDTLLRSSDIVSIHAPLTDRTRGLIGREALHKMKSTAVLLNLGRGAVVVEEELAEALDREEILAAGLDVLEQEPVRPDHPLLRIRNQERLIITPHIAWASVESRTRVVRMVYDKISDFKQSIR